MYNIEKHVDTFKDSYQVQADFNLDRFSDWSQELVVLMENRIYSSSFKDLVAFVSGKDFLVTRLTEDELDQQLTYCSQYKFLLSELRDDIAGYYTKIQKRYEVWYASVYNETRKLMLSEQLAEIKAGTRLKGSYDKFTKDDVRYRILEDKKQEYELWLAFLEKVEKSKHFVTNLADDLKNRAFTLMSLSKLRGITQ